MSDLERNLTELSSNLVKDLCPKKAVFTVSQTEEILRLDVVMNRLLIAELEKLKLLKNDSCLEHRVDVLECEVNKLIEYDEHNTEIVSCLRRDVNNLEKELTCTENKIHELSERIGTALLSQAHELQEVECAVKKLALKDYKDERIEDILRRLVVAEHREMKDCRIEAILHELCELKKINQVQNEHISELTAQNIHQSQEIDCLNEKLNRNTLALDNKIDTLERNDRIEAKVDLDQTASIKFLQGEIMKMRQEIDNFQKVMLTRSC